MTLFKSLKLVLILFAFSYSTIASAATVYSITFYERIGVGINLFDTNDYIVSGTASFSINDAAVTPNNLVLFTDSNFLAFDANITATVGSERFTLGEDDFPPKGDGAGLNKDELGILFDTSGQPLRFDNPGKITSNTAQICDPICDTAGVNKASLILWDEDVFDRVFLNDGTITTQVVAEANNDVYTRLNGEWGFIPFGSIDGINSNSLYQIQVQAVPIPAAVWLLGSGLIGLFGFAKRRAKTLAY